MMRLLLALLLVLGVAAPAQASDDTIRVAVIPDTQVETYRQSAARAKWIAVRNFDAVAHVGDVTDWGARDWSQFVRAQRWIRTLPDIPRAVAIGNHDTAAVGIGGSAFDPPRTGILLRDTTAFNRANLIPDPAGGWQANRDDNVWTPINSRWGLLTLELWPRPEAVEWARKVVRSQPKRKWIVVTHSCLSARGEITNGSSYGATSPRYLRDRLVRPNRNVRVVLCGHIGTTAVKRDKHATWILTNRTTPGRVRVLKVSPTEVRTWLRRTS
jgi:3',5'-cyclic AMP phosphodiesterase CpdA